MAKSSGDYRHPDRGQRDAYERYLAGMDASMRQKVALTAAHLLARGRVADQIGREPAQYAKSQIAGPMPSAGNAIIGA